MPLDLTSFAIKWQQTQLTEKSAYQQHFRDLCEALGVPHPTEEDLDGTNYTFEKHVTKVGGGAGFVDVWRRDAFAFEYKRPGEDLNKAYKQLNEYHEDLGNPPLLVVCDFKRFEVHTKFESQRSRVYKFDLEELRKNQPVPTSAVLPQDVLRFVFDNRNLLRPEAVTERVTRDAATDLLKLARQLELEHAATPNLYTKEQIAHFLIRIVFCLFADSIGLIPNNVFRKLVEGSHRSPIMFNRQLPPFFAAMSNRDSFFGAEIIPWFNGGLFSGSETIELNMADCGILRNAAKHDWSQIEPSIFGTLFERSLDASKRSMIGAHYTSPEDILLLIEPVVMTPLRREWASTRTAIEEVLAAEDGQTDRRSLRANRPAAKLLTEWAEGLSKVRILDPACGSGNFLYIAMKQLLDLWEEARAFGLKRGLLLPVESMPTPAQLYGIEIDFYAHEIASAVVWIGLLQWKRDHGYNDQPAPILKKLSNIEHADAIMRYDGSGRPYEPSWAGVDYIVGNPPFLGGKRLRTELGVTYVDDLFRLYEGKVPKEADLVSYWFEVAHRQILLKKAKRAGLLATQAIRAGANLRMLERLKSSGDIFFAWSDRPWVLAGANVRVSMIGFDDGAEEVHSLNGEITEVINANLSREINVASAFRLAENRSLSFMGTTQVGAFELSRDDARKMLNAPLNPNGKPNSDVVRRWVNGIDVTRRDRGLYVIDFGTDMSDSSAALYELPFEYAKLKIRPSRDNNNRETYRKKWWVHGEARPQLRRAVRNLRRFIVTPGVAKHRMFAWLSADVIPDHRIFVIAREDDYFFGVLHSRLHEAWSLASCSWHGDGHEGGRPTYNSSICFETFPFPYPPGTEPTEADSPVVRAIADAARELVRLRDAWLNPPGASEADLKTRTLTKLYNERVAGRATWLDNLHRTLDEAVFAAYGWPWNLTDQEILARLLALNHERAALQPQTTSRTRSARKRTTA